MIVSGGQQQDSGMLAVFLSESIRGCASGLSEASSLCLLRFLQHFLRSRRNCWVAIAEQLCPKTRSTGLWMPSRAALGFVSRTHFVKYSGPLGSSSGVRSRDDSHGAPTGVPWAHLLVHWGPAAPSSCSI